MITAYLVGISTYQEGEDIEIRFSIFEDEAQVCKKTIYKEYKKPQVVNQVALIRLLNELDKYKEDEVQVIINDPSLLEVIKGTSTNKNKDVLKMAIKLKEKLQPFENRISFKDVSTDSKALAKWDEVLKPE